MSQYNIHRENNRLRNVSNNATHGRRAYTSIAVHQHFVIIRSMHRAASLWHCCLLYASNMKFNIINRNMWINIKFRILAEFAFLVIIRNEFVLILDLNEFLINNIGGECAVTTAVCIIISLSVFIERIFVCRGDLIWHFDRNRWWRACCLSATKAKHFRLDRVLSVG